MTNAGYVSDGLRGALSGALASPSSEKPRERNHVPQHQLPGIFAGTPGSLGLFSDALVRAFATQSIVVSSLWHIVWGSYICDVVCHSVLRGLGGMRACVSPCH